MPDDIDNGSYGASHMGSASRDQSGVGLRVQGFCETVLEQDEVNFNSAVNPTLKTSEQDINAGIGRAKDHAKFYMDKVRPAIITNIANISNYYTLHDAVPSTLPAGTSDADWVATLRAMKEQADDYMAHARDIATMLGGFHDNLTTDVASFAKTVVVLNAAMNGDQGVLANLDRNLADVRGKIDGCIAGIVTSGLAIVGGAFLVGIGALAEFVTGGAATALVVGGLVIAAGGVAGTVAASITLAALQKQSADWLTQKDSLTQEVQLVQGMSTGFNSLRDQAKQAVAAATAMQNAWQFLSDDLGSLSGDLEKGITSSGVVRKLFLNASGTVVKTVIADTEIIKSQMTGVTVMKAPRDQSIVDFGQSLAKAA